MNEIDPEEAIGLAN